MRILNRPMFRYGGPIKEGVMHGMRNGGSIAGGNQIGTPMGNRTGFANPKDKLIMGAATKILPKIGLKPGFMKPWWAKVKNIFGSTAQAPYTPVHQVQSKGGKLLNLKPRWKTGGTGPNVGDVGKVWTPSGWVARDPLYRVGSAAWQGKGMLGKPIKWAGKQIATPTGGLGLIYVGTKWLWPDGTPANENEINEHLTKGGKKWDPGAGADQYDPSTSPSALAAAAKKARTEKLSKYLDMMGYDRAKKTAMSDALIDASAIVQQGTEEGGSLKHADWSKMINQAIQTTSKRLDKPEQIREAVGLMMTKGAIDKDIASGKESEAEKTMKLLGISKAEYRKKFLDEKSFAENKVIAFKTRSGQDAIDTAAEITYGPINGNIINVSDFADVYETMKDKTGDDDRTIVIKYTQAEINANPEKFNDGRYTVGENLVTIKDNKVISVE